MAAKLSVGYSLDQIPNDNSNTNLYGIDTQAVRSLECGFSGWGCAPIKELDWDWDKLKYRCNFLAVNVKYT
ncbi:hypothetical protein Ccrd_024072 [Cynara cardunculus var. scolymus]|uniref:Uncharacterized protein n=1 Tax=Cynara cardunculus var. scolymus TaxID=59895 RepID=A0A118DKL1_CYNCS|nr:hypothetical protein Ccrd_024072 [Cynara cardunculus var. scolymus]